MIIVKMAIMLLQKMTERLLKYSTSTSLGTVLVATTIGGDQMK